MLLKRKFKKTETLLNLGLVAPPTNGSLDVFRSYLYNPPSHTVQVIKEAIDYIQQKENLPKGQLTNLRSILLNEKVMIYNA